MTIEGTEGKENRQKLRFEEIRKQCCVGEAADSYGDCDSAAWPKGQYFVPVLNFASSEEKWLSTFSTAWKIATENGYVDKLFYLDNDKRDDLPKEEDKVGCSKLLGRR